MKKLTLRIKRRIMWILLLVGLVIFESAILFEGSWPQIVIGIALIFTAVVLDIIWWRCPHCGAYLDRGQHDGDYCRKCGQRVFWDNHDDFQDLGGH